MKRDLFAAARRVAFLLAVLAYGASMAAAHASPLEALLAPDADLWPRWTAHDDASPAIVDHGTWNDLLRRHVVQSGDGIHRFAYSRVTAEDRAALAGYVAGLAAVRVGSLSRAEQFAYWVNLYNALTVGTVLDHYPVASIRDIDITPGLFADGPWGRTLVAVEGEPLSLDDIEHRILRPIWRDPRVHYAVNCASIGCPNLAREAFTAENADRLLDQGAHAYINHRRGARPGPDGLVVSKIYLWFRDDFGGDRGVLAHLGAYAEGEVAAALAAGADLGGYAYDWALNDAPTGAPH